MTLPLFIPLEFRKHHHKKNINLTRIILAIIILLTIGWGGFLVPDQEVVLIRLAGHHTIWKIANYEESGLDWEGEYYSDTWSEQISEIYEREFMVDDKGFFVFHSSLPLERGKLRHPAPDITRKYDRGKYFENTQTVERLVINAVYIHQEEEESVRISEKEYNLLKDRIRDTLTLKSWYNVPMNLVIE